MNKRYAYLTGKSTDTALHNLVGMTKRVKEYEYERIRSWNQ